MTFDNTTFEITVAQHDYGIPIKFNADREDGFTEGDVVIFCFCKDSLDDKPFTIHYAQGEDTYEFAFKFIKEEADSLFDHDVLTYEIIKYSIKRYKDGQYLETLENELGEVIFNLKVLGTVNCDGPIESTESAESET